MAFQPFQDPGSEQEPQGPYDGPRDPYGEAQTLELALSKAGSGAYPLQQDGGLHPDLAKLFETVQDPKIREKGMLAAKDQAAMAALFPLAQLKVGAFLTGGPGSPEMAMEDQAWAKETMLLDVLDPFYKAGAGLLARWSQLGQAPAGSFAGFDSDRAGKELLESGGLVDRHTVREYVPAIVAMLEANATPEQLSAIQHLRARGNGNKYLDGLAYEAIQDYIGKEADEYSLGFKTFQAGYKGVGHLAMMMSAWGAGEAVGAAAGSKLAAVAGLAPRAATVVRTTLRNFGAGAFTGGLEATSPFSLHEVAFIEQSGNPDGTRAALMGHRFIEGVAMAPFIALAGIFGKEITAGILGKSSLLRGVPTLGRRVAAGTGGAFATSTALAFSPVLHSASTPEQQIGAFDLIAKTLNGTITGREIEDFTASFVGGLFAPFAALGVAHQLAAYSRIRSGRAAQGDIPPLDAQSRSVLDGFITEVKEKYPKELRWLYGLRNEDLAHKAGFELQKNLTQPVTEIRDMAREEMAAGEGWQERVRARVLASEHPLAAQLADVGIAYAEGKIGPRNWAGSDPIARWRQALSRWVSEAFIGKVREEREAGNLPRQGLPGQPSGQPALQPGGDRARRIPLGPANPPQRRAPIPAGPGGPEVPQMGGQEPARPDPAARSYPRSWQQVLVGQGREHREAVEREFQGPGADRLLQKWRSQHLDAPEFEDAAADVTSRVVAGLEDALAATGKPLPGDQAGALVWQEVKGLVSEMEGSGQLPDGVGPAVFFAQTLRRLLPALQSNPATRAAVAPFIRQHADELHRILDREAVEFQALPTRYFAPEATPAEVAEAEQRAMEALQQALSDRLTQALEGDDNRPRAVPGGPAQAAPGASSESAGVGGSATQPAAKSPGGAPEAPGGTPTVPRETSLTGGETKPETGETSETASAEDAARKVAREIVATEGGPPAPVSLLGAHMVTEQPLGGGKVHRTGWIPTMELRTHPKLQPRNEGAGLGRKGPFGTDMSRVLAMARNWSWNTLEPISAVHLERPPSAEWEAGWQGPGWYVVGGHHRYAAARLRTDPEFARQYGHRPEGDAVESLPARLFLGGQPGEPTIEQIVDMSAAGNIARSQMNVLQEAAAVAGQVRAGRKVEDVAAGYGKDSGWGQAMVDIAALAKGAPTIEGLLVDQKALGDPADVEVFNILRLLAGRHRHDPKTFPPKLLAQIVEVAGRKGLRRAAIEDMLNRYEIMAKIAEQAPEQGDQGPALPGMEDVVAGQRFQLEILSEVARAEGRARSTEARIRSAKAQVGKLDAASPEDTAAHARTFAGLEAEHANAKKMAAGWDLVSQLIAHRSLTPDMLQEMSEASGLQVGAGGAIEKQKGGKPDWRKVDMALRKLTDRMQTLNAPLFEAEADHAIPADIGTIQRGGGESGGEARQPAGRERAGDRVQPGARGGGAIPAGSDVSVAGRAGRVIEFRPDDAGGRYVIEFPGERDLGGNPVREERPIGDLSDVKEPAPEAPRSNNKIFTDEMLEEGLAQLRQAGTPAGMRLKAAEDARAALERELGEADAKAGGKEGLAGKRHEKKRERLRQRLEGAKQEEADLREEVRKSGEPGNTGEFHAGLNTSMLEGLLKVGGYYIEKGLRDFGKWLAAMHERLKAELPGMDPASFDHYLRSVWNALAQKHEFQEYELRPVAAKRLLSREQRGVPKDDLQVELDADAQFAPDPENADAMVERVGIEEQLAATRQHEVERANQGLPERDDNVAGRNEILYDEYDGVFPDPSRIQLDDPAWKILLPHQVFGAKAILAAWETGPAFILADGTGTGKTWTALVAAKERQSKVGGKILIVTSGRTAIAGWARKDFPALGLTQKPVSVRNLDKGDVAITIWHSLQSQNIAKMAGVRKALQSGEIKTIIADESHAMKNWAKGTAQALNAIQFFDEAMAAGAKVVYTSATPAEEPQHMRYLAQSFLDNPTDEGMASWLESIGYSRKGQGQSSFVVNPRKADLTLAAVIATRANMAERGVILNREQSYHGVITDFAGVPLSDANWAQWESVSGAFDLLADAIDRAGMGGLKRLVGAWYANTMHRYAEDWYIPEAVNWARHWIEQGGRVVLLSETRSEGAEERITRALEKPRGREQTSILERIALSGDAGAVEVLRERAAEFDKLLGSPPATLTKILTALQGQVPTLRAGQISGERTTVQRGDVVEQWRRNELDVIAATRQTAGESISLHDEVGRPVLGLILGTPWTASEVTQATGRFHRLMEATKPRIVFMLADDIPSEAQRAGRVAARMASLRATVRGVHTNPRTLQEAVDGAAFFLGAMHRERAQMSALAADRNLLRLRRSGQAPEAQATTGYGPGEMDGGKLPGDSITKSEADPPGPMPRQIQTFEDWKAETTRLAEILTQPTPERMETDAVPLPDVADAAELAHASKRLGQLLSDPAVRGREAEAAQHVEGLIAARKRAAGERGAFDLEVLAAPFKLAWKYDPLHRIVRSLVSRNLEGIGDERFALPPKLNRSWVKMVWLFGTPENKWGYLAVEPLTRELSAANVDLHNSERRFTEQHEIAVKGSGGLRPYFTKSAPLLSMALSGEHYRAGLHPEHPQARLGRWEEYVAGSRNVADFGQEPARSGLSPQEWLEAQPKYSDYLEKDPSQRHLAGLYREARNTLDWIRSAAAANDYQYRQYREEQQKAALLANIAKTPERAQFWLQKAAEAEAAADKRFAGWGWTDYFAHTFDRKGKRELPGWTRRDVPREVYSRYTEGRVDWALGWSEDFDRVYWSYLRTMVRKIHLDRALVETSGLIEGEWNQVHFDGQGFRSLNPGPLYEAGGEQRLLSELVPKTRQKIMDTKGGVIDFYHRALLYHGEMVRPEVVGKGIGQRVLRLIKENSTDVLEEMPVEAARGLVAYAKTGGLRQVWEGSRSQHGYKNWIRRILGPRDYGLFMGTADALAGWMYHSMLGFLRFPAGITNLIGGMVMNVYKLGPRRTARGLAALMGKDRQKYRRVLQDGGMLTPAQQYMTEAFARSYSRGDFRPGLGGMAARAASTTGRTFSRVSLVFFNASEWLNRSTAFLAGYIPGREAGLPLDGSQVQGLRAVGRTQFHMDSVNAPVLFHDPRLRMVLQFSGYGIRFANTFGLDIFRSVRAARESFQGGARGQDVRSAQNIMQGAAGAFAAVALYEAVSAILQQVLFDDEDAEGMSAESLFLTKVRDIPVVGDAWQPIAMQLQEATGVDASGLGLPILLPYGLGPGIEFLGEGADAVIGAAKGDPNAMKNLPYRLGRYAIPLSMQRFMQLSDVDISDDPSAIQEFVDDAQAAIRGIPGMRELSPEAEKNYGAFRIAWDRERPYTMFGQSGTKASMHVSGPESWSRFLFAGRYQEGEYSPKAEDVMEDWMTENERQGFRRATVREIVWESTKHATEGRYEESRMALEEASAKAREYGITFDDDFVSSARREYPLRQMPANFRAAYYNGADRTEVWEFLLRLKEADAMTELQFFEAVAVLQRGKSNGLGRWLAEDDDNLARFKRAYPGSVPGMTEQEVPQK